MEEVIICDLDGTLAIHNGRTPFEYHKCDTDLPNRPVVELVKRLGLPVIYMSGRDDSCFKKTKQWLRDHGLPEGELLMRTTGDRRKDAVVKRELYEQHIEGKYEILFVLDDRDQVVDLWRKDLGLTCLQVAYGDLKNAPAFGRLWLFAEGSQSRLQIINAPLLPCSQLCLLFEGGHWLTRRIVDPQ